MDASQMDTIKTILRDYRVDDFLDSREFADLVNALEQRDIVMRNDARQVGARSV